MLDLDGMPDRHGLLWLTLDGSVHELAARPLVATKQPTPLQVPRGLVDRLASDVKPLPELVIVEGA
jgi:hypothetical protein